MSTSANFTKDNQNSDDTPELPVRKQVQVQVKVTLRLAVSHCVKVWSPLWDLRPDITPCPKAVS
jgi:hypothetical protein